MRICRSAPFALRLLVVDHFFICDFESLRVAGLHQLANSNNFRNSLPPTAVPLPVREAKSVSPHLRHCCLGRGQSARHLRFIQPFGHNIVINRVNRQIGHRYRSIRLAVACNGHTECMGLGLSGGVYYRTSNKKIRLP